MAVYNWSIMTANTRLSENQRIPTPRSVHVHLLRAVGNLRSTTPPYMSSFFTVPPFTSYILHLYNLFVLSGRTSPYGAFFIPKTSVRSPAHRTTGAPCCAHAYSFPSSYQSYTLRL